MEIKERLTPGFVKEKAAISAQENAIDLAAEKGVNPDLLANLGKAQSEIDFDRPNNKALIVGAAIVAGSMVAYGAGSSIPEDMTVDQFLIDTINSQLQLLPINLPSNKIRDIEQNVAALTGSIAFLYLVLRYLGSRAENSVKNLGNKLRLKDKTDTLNSSVLRGESRVNIGPGHIVIDLGTNGDSIGNELGNRFEWAKGSIPILEGESNDSDSPLWVKVPNASQAVKRDEFYESLDRARFDTASVFVICPQSQEQAFLPDPKDRSHFDLGTADVLKRVALADEYCEERGIPQKDVIIIGDKTVKTAVGPSYGDQEGEREVTREFSLEQIIDVLNARRKGEIIIADPTEIALQHLSGKDYNPQGLPLEFYENPYSETRYGARFIERCKAMGIDVIESAADIRESLKVVHGASDVESVHVASLIDGDLSSYEGTVTVLVDSSKRVGGWQHSVVLSEVVTDWICERLISGEKEQSNDYKLKPRSTLAGM